MANFENILKQIDNLLLDEPACSSQLDYVEQSSWLIFLKYLNDYENEQEQMARLEGNTYQRIIENEYKWNEWAAPKNSDGTNDVIHAMTGDDLIEFVNERLFPYLRSFQDKTNEAETLVYKIGMIFEKLSIKITKGYTLREILWKVDQLSFGTADERHQMSVLYESRLHTMGSAGKNGGQFYTPRALIRTIVKAVNPKIGQTIFDPACGSAGFLCEAFNYLNPQVKNTDQMNTLQKHTFYGQEYKPLPYIIAVMNMIFHGVEAPNIKRMDSLSVNIMQLMPSEKRDIILANPPFGTKVTKATQNNFPIPSSESANLFMELFVRYLKAGGRAGIVIKNTFLSNTDGASIAIRRMLLDDCRLDAVLDLPQGVFSVGVRTVVLFFTKGEPTTKIWYYQLNLDRNLGKTNPLNENDLADFLKQLPQRSDTENSWTVLRENIDETTLDLSVKNPHTPEEAPLRQPSEIIADLISLQNDNIAILNAIKEDKE